MFYLYFQFWHTSCRNYYVLKLNIFSIFTEEYNSMLFDTYFILYQIQKQLSSSNIYQKGWKLETYIKKKIWSENVLKFSSCLLSQIAEKEGFVHWKREISQEEENYNKTISVIKSILFWTNVIFIYFSFLYIRQKVVNCENVIHLFLTFELRQ